MAQEGEQTFGVDAQGSVQPLAMAKADMERYVPLMLRDDSFVCRFSTLLRGHLKDLDANVIFMMQKENEQTRTASHGSMAGTLCQLSMKFNQGFLVASCFSMSWQSKLATI